MEISSSCATMGKCTYHVVGSVVGWENCGCNGQVVHIRIMPLVIALIVVMLSVVHHCSIAITHPPCKQTLAAVVVVLVVICHCHAICCVVLSVLSSVMLSVMSSVMLSVMSSVMLSVMLSIVSSIMLSVIIIDRYPHPPCKQMIAAAVVVLVAVVVTQCQALHPASLSITTTHPPCKQMLAAVVVVLVVIVVVLSVIHCHCR